MRQAFMLLGIMTLVVTVGAFIAFERAEAPTDEPTDVPIITDDNALPMPLTLTSPEFEEGGLIPSRFTCDGDNINPALNIAGVPEGTNHSCWSWTTPTYQTQ